MGRRFIVIGAVVIVALAAGGYYFYSQRTAANASTSSLQTGEVTRGSLVASVSSAGTLASPQTAAVNWQTSGTVGPVYVEVGQVVEAGTVLAELDQGRATPAMLQAQVDLLAAQTELDDLLAGATAQQLADARLAVLQAQQAITTAQRSLNNALNPVSATLVDQTEDARVSLETAQANLQLLNASADITALQNQIFLTNWYLNRLNQIKEESKGFENNPDVHDKIERAQIDYQAQLDKQYALQLQIDTARTTKTNDVRNAQSAYDQAVANLQAAQRGPDNAKVALYQAQLDVARANFEQTQAALAELEAGPDAQDVAAARAKVAKAQAVVDTVKVTAPFRGTVVAVTAQTGDNVSANQAAVTLADLSRFQLDVSVAEVDINAIRVGQTAELTVDAAPNQAFQGEVTAVAYLGSSQQGVVNFPVTIVITNPDPALKAGMTAGVAIVTERRENVLLVPNRALRTSAGQRTVTVLFEGQQISVPVTVGLSNDTSSEILSGQLREGDTVVIVGSTATGATTNTRTFEGPGGGGFVIDGGGPFGP
ncbi:MAG: efflux RND transporter periplasmic adaptor subunit [Anaerolineales bacterium]|nr:efflux RND transporter periplasmic adaptor subunit [Anaerolineales bacterium]